MKQIKLLSFSFFIATFSISCKQEVTTENTFLEIVKSEKFIDEFSWETGYQLAVARADDPVRLGFFYLESEKLESIITSLSHVTNEEKFNDYTSSLLYLESLISNKYQTDVNLRTKTLEIIKNNLINLNRIELQILLKLNLACVNNTLSTMLPAEFIRIDNLNFELNYEGDSIRLIPTLFNRTQNVRLIIDQDSSGLSHHHLTISKTALENSRNAKIQLKSGIGKWIDFPIKTEGKLTIN